MNNQINQESTPAIIILRHATDINDPKDWLKCKNDKDPQGWCRFPLPDGNIVRYPWSRLNTNGKIIKEVIAKVLPDWINNLKINGENIYPVSRIVTKNPQNYEKTQNPFETIYPFVQEIGKNEKSRVNGRPVKVKLWDDPYSSKFNEAYLLKDGPFSTVICWDAEGLFADKIKCEDAKRLYPEKIECKDGKKVRPPVPDEHSILRTLIRKDEDFNCPVKGTTFFVLTNPDEDGRFKHQKFTLVVDYANKEGKMVKG